MVRTVAQWKILMEGYARGHFFSEERVVFSCYPYNQSVMTVARIRKVFNRTDGKAIARQLAYVRQ